MFAGVFRGGYECESYGTSVYAGLLPICVFFLLVRLLYWCAFCTLCNLCFSLTAYRFSLVSLCLRIAFLYLQVRVFCGVLVHVSIVVHVSMSKRLLCGSISLHLVPCEPSNFSIARLFTICVVNPLVCCCTCHCSTCYVSLLCMLFLAQCYCPLRFQLITVCASFHCVILSLIHMILRHSGVYKYIIKTVNHCCLQLKV